MIKRKNDKLKISTKTRWAKAGAAQAAVIIENVHGLYLRDNALQYLNSLLPPLIKEFVRRKLDWKKVRKGENP